MTWVRLDDKFHDNPKQLRASHAAVRVWVCSMSYCADATEPTGWMSKEQAISLVRKVGASRKVISELLGLRAWEEYAGGYAIHDFENYVSPRSTERVRAFRKRNGNAAETPPPGYIPVPVPEPVPEPVGVLTPSVGSPHGLEWKNRGSFRGGDMEKLGTILPAVRVAK